VRSPAEVRALYRDWAADYDDDVYGAAGVTGTDRIADLLAAHVADRIAPVLDLGCGTGAAGVRLRQHGFGALDGVDLSMEMLRKAASKGVYRSLVQADLGRRPPYRAGAFRAAVSAGTFVPGHVGPDAVAGICDVLAPGAVVAWTIADWESFAAVVAGWDVLHLAHEAIGLDGPPVALLVARPASTLGT
jgi:predicted TPR repeat methyltransferase